MQKITYTFLFLLLCYVTAPAQPVAAPKGAAVDETGGKKYAILIGVNDYIQLPKLRYAKSDIEALQNELYKIGFDTGNVYTLTCGGETKNQPTKRNIEVVLGNVLEMAREGDIIVIAMNGHGIETEGQARFCPIDTLERNLVDSTIPISDIFKAFENSQATFKLMLVDACRENPFTSRNIAGALALQTLTDPPKGVMLFQSCANGELSYENPELKRGVFTHYLVEGLQGKAADKDGKVTFLGLAKYTTESTQRHVLDWKRERQRPYLRGEFNDFVLAEDTFLALKEEVFADYQNVLQAFILDSWENVAKYLESHSSKASTTWKQAAELGMPEGQFLWALCLSKGYGVARDETEGFKWLCKAAGQGFANAQSNLGYCYDNGIGVSKDEYEAVKWYRKAAEQGDTGAQEALKRPWGAVTRTPSFLRRGIQTKGFNPLRLNPAFAGMTREAKG
jgi:hypothetical protein